MLLLSPPTYGELAEDLAWASACTRLTKTYPVVANCAEVPRPYVIYTRLVTKLGNDGTYVEGEPFVFVNPLAPDRLRVVVHEYAHYILYESGAGKGMSACQQEKAVRKVAEHPWTLTERKKYGCLKG